jgi:hypothetical protein
MFTANSFQFVIMQCRLFILIQREHRFINQTINQFHSLVNRQLVRLYPHNRSYHLTYRRNNSQPSELSSRHTQWKVQPIPINAGRRQAIVGFVSYSSNLTQQLNHSNAQRRLTHNCRRSVQINGTRD